jgi:malonyl CoA-acyl carrier protein transacylase
MKSKNLIQKLLASVKIALRFGGQHYAALSMLEGVYVRQPLHEKLFAGLDTTLTITLNGSLYHVTRTDYVNDEPALEQRWLATYGWHSTGHLIEIGGDRYCILDTATKSLYLEELTESGKTILELFTKNY